MYMDKSKKTIQELKSKYVIKFLAFKIIGGTETDERRTEKNQFKI